MGAGPGRQTDATLRVDDAMPRQLELRGRDLERVAEQMDTALLPVYVQIVPDAVQSQPPFANPPELDLSEGSHFGYAVQWFSFATLLLVGYPFYARRQDQRKES